MASAQIFHLLTNPPVADYPDGATLISATTPDFSILTTLLLDPAVPPAGAVQTLHQLQLVSQNLNATKNFVWGRWITRRLPAQTIGAGNWTFNAVMRDHTASANSQTLWGMCIAQWRAGAGVVARFLDSPTGGAAVTIPNTNSDRSASTTIAGGALTLALNDQIVLEVWSRYVFPNSAIALDEALLFNGMGQYGATTYTYNTLTDTDAYLKAPAAITYL